MMEAAKRKRSASTSVQSAAGAGPKSTTSATMALSKPEETSTAGGSPDLQRGVVYIGRIPHGWVERGLRGYFEQFGTVKRVRISRNKHTGASKHYGWLQFADPSVAEIAAKTMDKYLLFGHILRVKVVPPSDVHEDLWKGANRRFTKIPWAQLQGKQLSRAAGESEWETRRNKEGKRRAARAKKLKEMGYEFEGPELKVAQAIAAPALEDKGEKVLALEEGKGSDAEE